MVARHMKAMPATVEQYPLRKILNNQSFGMKNGKEVATSWCQLFTPVMAASGKRCITCPITSPMS